MATLNPCHLFSASAHLQSSTKLALKIKYSQSFNRGFKNGLAECCDVHAFGQGVNHSRLLHHSRRNIPCAMNMAAGQSDDSGKILFNQFIGKTRKLWERSPQPVKIFPWKRAGMNFIQLILDLILAVIKYLCVPLLVVSSLSEMSYCAYERKLFFVPVLIFVGVAVAEASKRAALDVSPLLKDAEVPWHLIVMAVFFTILKLPGPYYPFWGKIIIPQVANGGLFRTLWCAFMWHRRPKKVSGSMLSQHSESGSQSEPNEL